jgi:hypothetical protein
MLHAYVERFNMMGERESILGWDGKWTRAKGALASYGTILSSSLRSAHRESCRWCCLPLPAGPTNGRSRITALSAIARTHARFVSPTPYGLLPTDLVVLAAPYSVTLIVLKSEEKKLMHDARSPRWAWSHGSRWFDVDAVSPVLVLLCANFFSTRSHFAMPRLEKKTGENILKSCCAHYISDDGNKSNTPARDALINIPCDQQRIPS